MDDDNLNSEIVSADSLNSSNSISSLPSISPSPKTYSGCCLALSSQLLSYLSRTLPPAPSLILSIGSGYGLLEALLIRAPYSANIVGVEVHPSSNQYLPSSHHRDVSGTRFLDELAAEATAWMFVYPRRVGLVSEYIKVHGDESVQTILWIGPQADWVDYEGCFGTSWNVQITPADEVGGRLWDMVAVVTKCHS